MEGPTFSERYIKRNQYARFYSDAYFKWVDALNVIEGSSLGKAVNYAMNNKSGLLGYLADGRVELSTNWIEGNIRKFVIGRKNFVAVDTVAGAKASAVCYSIVLTAQDNGLNVYLPPACYLNSNAENDNLEQLQISSIE